LEDVWNRIDFKGMWNKTMEGLADLMSPLGEYILEAFYVWLNSDNNVFTKCFFALADTAVKRGKGPA
jgi:hypothetical protein